MKSLDIDFLNQQSIPIEMGGLLQKLGEYKGRQDLFQHQTPQVLETLKRISIIESTESSNRIEGRLTCSGTGRGALWEKRGNNFFKRGNKRGNN